MALADNTILSTLVPDAYTGRIGTGGAGIDIQRLQEKYEETYIPDYSDEGYTKDDARLGILDKRADVPWLESMEPWRNTGSIDKLNLKYKGNRSGQTAPPRHPEMFMGFVGSDPRGSNTANPRFDEYRKFTNGLMTGILPRMGKNDDTQLSERSIGGARMSYIKKELMEDMRKRAKWFRMQRENIVRRTNVVARGAGTEAGMVAIMRDGLGDGANDNQLNPVFSSVDKNVVYRQDPWRHANLDGDFGVMNYNVMMNGGLKPRDNAAAQAMLTDTDQVVNDSTSVYTMNRQTLTASITLARTLANIKKQYMGDEVAGLQDKAIEVFVSKTGGKVDDMVKIKHLVESDDANLKDPKTVGEMIARSIATVKNQTSRVRGQQKFNDGTTMTDEIASQNGRMRQGKTKSGSSRLIHANIGDSDSITVNQYQAPTRLHQQSNKLDTKGDSTMSDNIETRHLGKLADLIVRRQGNEFNQKEIDSLMGESLTAIDNHKKHVEKNNFISHTKDPVTTDHVMVTHGNDQEYRFPILGGITTGKKTTGSREDELIGNGKYASGFNEKRGS